MSAHQLVIVLDGEQFLAGIEGQPVGCIHTFRPASKRIHFEGRGSRDCKTEEIDLTDSDSP